MYMDISTIEREYDQKRMNALKENEEHLRSVYVDIPELTSIDSKIKKLGIEASKKALSSGINDSNILKQIEKLKSEKEKLLLKKGISLEPKYECEKCKDTGYITENGSSQMCSCMKQRIIDLYYNKYNSLKLKFETFDNFDDSLYSDKPNKEKYGVSISPRENITKIRKIAEDFINNFESEKTNNLLFTGTAGTGKTFISGAIANELLNSGHTVIYQTAPLLMDSIFEFKYGGKSKTSKELYESLFDVDLLIIDDLGTESKSDAKFAELFSIINSRMLNPNTKTIISTNLNLNQLSKSYDDRIISRLIGQYDICKFFGDDIRLKK